MLKSKTIQMRLVEVCDAEFILSLRLDERYNKFISAVSSDLQKQRDWIESYKIDEACGNQYYFIIERLDGTPCGTVRIYDLLDDSFCWGSWILNEDKTKYAALESAFMVYNFGFNTLLRGKSHFDVVKGNEGVVSFHTRMGAKIVGEDELNFYFEITRQAVELSRANVADKIS